MKLGVSVGISLILHSLLFLLIWGLPASSRLPLAGGGGEVEVWVGSQGEEGTKGKEEVGIGKRGEGKGSGSGPQGEDPLLAEIRSRIERSKRYPELARRLGLTGRVQIQFEIDPRGEASEVQISQSSGSHLLDAEALATVRRGAPYPPFEKPLSVWLKFASEEGK